MRELNKEIENSLNIIKREWLASPSSYPEFTFEFSNESKIKNEQYIQGVIKGIQNQLKSFPRFPIGRKKWKQKTIDMFKEVICTESIIGIRHSMDQQALESFQEEILEFLRNAREFAPEMGFEEIGQAIRNYIVYKLFKEINQLKSGFYKAGFGYSMLYPFTDNYIDSEQYNDEAKGRYNQIIRNKIMGKEVNTKTSHEQKTCELLQEIEAEYPRNIDATMSDLLVMMLDAQEKSIRQQKKGVQLSEEERLDISLYKGGISVLIDRFLVKKDLTENDMIFYLGFGFFLQLADDLQDIYLDSTNNHQTIFTIDLHHEQLEQIVNKMVSFLHVIIDTYQSENKMLKNIILPNCHLLIIAAIADNKKFFSKGYVEDVEKYFPVSYPFLEKLKIGRIDNQDVKVQNTYMKMLDELLLY